MKAAKYIATALATGVALMGATLSAATNPIPRTLEDQVRHEILMVPYIGVFDNLSYKVDNGVVTARGTARVKIFRQGQVPTWHQPGERLDLKV